MPSLKPSGPSNTVTLVVTETDNFRYKILDIVETVLPRKSNMLKRLHILISLRLELTGCTGAEIAASGWSIMW